MRILDFYQDRKRQEELKQLLILGAQKHPFGLPASFLEKDLWVVEILRLLYEERLLGDFAVAFKGGTALSKCWKAIDRFSEDIDLSIHWPNLAGEKDEVSAWEASIQSGKQRKKFRKRQGELLTEWSSEFVERLNERLAEYGVDGLYAELEKDSAGEKVNIHFPRVTVGTQDYQLDHVLLEFGGRNRGRPTEQHTVTSYMSDIPELKELTCPQAVVDAYDPAYILWEKLTALHQFSTMTREPPANRLARHWYDVDCLLRNHIADPFSTAQAMKDVVEMKTQRWPEGGVDYEAVLRGELRLIPDSGRLATIAEDHQAAMVGGMFYAQPDDFNVIVERLTLEEEKINRSLLESWMDTSVRWLHSGAWMQAVIERNGDTVYSELTLRDNPERALNSLIEQLIAK